MCFYWFFFLIENESKSNSKPVIKSEKKKGEIVKDSLDWLHNVEVLRLKLFTGQSEFETLKNHIILSF